MNTNEFDAEAQRLAGVEKRKRAEQEAVEEKQKLLVRSNYWRTCINCEHFRDVRKVLLTKETNYKHCSLYKAVPPPEVILHGCKEWQNDDIPF